MTLRECANQGSVKSSQDRWGWIPACAYPSSTLIEELWQQRHYLTFWVYAFLSANSYTYIIKKILIFLYTKVYTNVCPFQLLVYRLVS